MNKILLLFLIIFSVELAHAQSKFTISGTIFDSKTGETVIGATVVLKDGANIGAVANTYGFYSLTIPEGNSIIMVRFIGYKTIERTIDLHQNIKLDFKLEEDAQTLGEVVITAEKRNEQITNSESVLKNLTLKK